MNIPEPPDDQLRDLAEDVLTSVLSRLSAHGLPAGEPVAGATSGPQINDLASNQADPIEERRAARNVGSDPTGEFEPVEHGEPAPAPIRSATDHIERIVALHSETLAAMREFTGHLETLAQHHERMIGEIQSLRAWSQRTQIRGLNRFSY